MVKIIYNFKNLPIEIIDEYGKHQFAKYDNEIRLLVFRDGAGNEVKHGQKTFASSNLPVKIGFPTSSQIAGTVATVPLGISMSDIEDSLAGNSIGWIFS